MRVYVLSEYYDNCVIGERKVDGDIILGTYSTYDKAKQAAMEYNPKSFGVEADSQRKVEEITVKTHVNEGVVRDLRESVGDDYQYVYELYITETELDAPAKEVD